MMNDWSILDTSPIAVKCGTDLWHNRVLPGI